VTSAEEGQATGAEELITLEIRALRKGRGIHAPGLDERLGPHLRELAVEGGAGGAASRRDTLAAELNALARLLPEDLRTAISASLGLSAKARDMPHFDDRMTWLAAQLGCGPRTAQRRVDDAEPLLAEEVARELRRRRSRTPAAPKGWYLEEFRVVLRMDTELPEAHEHRRIVATRDDLREIMAWHNVPGSKDRPGPALNGEVLYGGRLLRREQPSDNRFHFVVRLPEPLRAGDKHDYGLLLRVSDGQAMRPHYIFTPECECKIFDLRVRFDPSRPPRWIRRVCGEPVRVFDSARPRGDRVGLDEAGELHLQFPNPTLYLGYGIQWLPPSPTPSPAERHDE